MAHHVIKTAKFALSVKTTGTVLVVGRWQPFHLGHLRLMMSAFRLGRRVMVVMGSSNESRSARNPLTVRERSEMMRRALGGRSYGVVPVRDLGNDRLWLGEVKRKCGKFDIVMTGNAYTASIFRKAGYKVIRPQFFRKKECNATHIRSLVRKGKRWKRLVPRAVLEYLEENGLIGKIRESKGRGSGCLGACRGKRGQD